MHRTQGKKRLIITIIILGVFVLIAGGIAWASTHKETSGTKNSDTSQVTQVKKDEPTTETDNSPSVTTEVKPTVVMADPATLSTVDIDPMHLVVSYTKGIPGFDFVIKHTADRTEYVEFSAAELVGTKCTDDDGSFASIIKNPSADENQTTIAQKVVAAGDTYGLSLYGRGCTNNTELLDQYQTAFSGGFTSLKAI